MILETPAAAAAPRLTAQRAASARSRDGRWRAVGRLMLQWGDDASVKTLEIPICLQVGLCVLQRSILCLQTAQVGPMAATSKHDARVIHVKLGCRSEQPVGEVPFAGNGISTTKYNVITFLPKNLFEQFQRIANAYFLIMSILATIPAISPVSPVTSWAPLIFVLSVTAVREAMEDYKRGKSDTELNFRNTLLYKADTRTFVEIFWKDVRVGDVVKVVNNEFIPSDIVLLGCSEPSDIAYVETANLDGETNLKPKNCVNADSKVLSYDWSALNSTVVCPLPNNDIFKFDAYTDATLGGESSQISLTVNNLLMRGCKLKNTQYAIGIVVYTGNETKMMKNLTKGAHKTSNIESKLNYLIVILFCFQALCCIVQSIAASIFMRNSASYWYLKPDKPSITFDLGNVGYASFLTYARRLAVQPLSPHPDPGTSPI
jgi:magnesium-transporting ATPase (P-type)